jgi:hypothetical protein
MAFANSAITDIIATTIQSRSGELADNLTENNAILQRLNSKGNVRPFSGGNVILEEIMYNDPNTNNANSIRATKYSTFPPIRLLALPNLRLHSTQTALLCPVLKCCRTALKKQSSTC